MPDAVENVVILGSGPAGLTAAVYTARANLRPIVIEGAVMGGQLMTTTDVENYPGFPKGILGPELMELMHQQAERFETRFIRGDVTAVNVRERPFTVTTDDGQTLKTKTLVVATGASAMYMGLPSEKALLGHGVSACATCDGFFFKGKEVVVVGGGDTAMEESTFLTKFASKVTIVHRRDAFRASKIMQERALNNPKIAVVWDSVLEEVHDPAAKKVTGVRLKHLKTHQTTDLRCDGVFLAICHTPNTEFLKGQVALDVKGYLVVRDQTRTSVEGVFSAGDVHDIRYRQAVTAAGSGCMAALDVEKYLEGLGSHG
ncbi:MAG: thioredoxin-disulfide reductase [Omnitrophica WOR_2 bacterium RIFCSPHIGHO2_02_FULL_68_15]|nr:MAG: thioredoxin-disulfide reductase [Omnitrophica WOR_2 bacterium RIFCSPHIGHO2_02_FULL_68_15]